MSRYYPAGFTNLMNQKSTISFYAKMPKNCVLLDNSAQNISVFLKKKKKKICVIEIKSLILRSKSDNKI